MKDNERNLSDYIDSLNKEQRPGAHDELTSSSEELNELFSVVRLVRSLKEPDMPKENFEKKLTYSVEKELLERESLPKSKKPWFIGLGAIAAVLTAIIVLSSLFPLGKSNVVYAMSRAFEDVKAYHGYIEIDEINGNQTSTIQAKLEVWANKEGHYYVKELTGGDEGLTTINNGTRKWQIIPNQKYVCIFPAFPDPYLFTFELGKEIDEIKDALSTKIIGEENIAGRPCTVIEVSPKGGIPYRIWIDKGTKLPLQKQSSMQNALQYKITYTNIEFIDSIPSEIITYKVPDGFKEINASPEQLVNNIGEASEVVGFEVKTIQNMPGYLLDRIAIDINNKVVKQYFTSHDKVEKVIILQKKSDGNFKPASNSMLGKIGNSTAEIMSPVEDNSKILQGGVYSGLTNIRSIRWQQSGYEYDVAGNTSVEELASFVKALTNESVNIPHINEDFKTTPEVTVPVDLKVEENDQKSIDAGHSPWKLDPVFVSQVFVSLKISPEGIKGEYPIKYEDLKVIQNNGKAAIVEVPGNKTPVRKVYLKRLIRQDITGIWTVVGYDPVK